MYLCSYGKPARGGAAKKSISDASFRPTEAVSDAPFGLTEAAHKTVDTTRFRLTEADTALFRKLNYLSRPRKYMI